MEKGAPSRIVTKNLFVKFTDEKKLEIADRITALNEEIDHIESQKKRVTGLREEISAHSHSYRRGGETLPIECTVYYDTPTEGKKFIVRNDTGEEVGVELMTQEELQGDLPFNGELGVTDGSADDVQTSDAGASEDEDQGELEIPEGEDNVHRIAAANRVPQEETE